MADETVPPIERLKRVMVRLRDPNGGCPWDQAQTFATIAPYTIEEAYEVADAIERGDFGDLKIELGDLLFQVIFHARMAEEQGLFDFDAVAAGMAEKLERRHPWVFGDEAAQGDAGAQKGRWEDIKAEERKARAQHGVLDDVPVGLPALTRAHKLTKRAARVGFDWPDVSQVIDKLHEELGELQAEIAAGDTAKAREEVGDLLFVVANLARKLEVEPEDALRTANAKFVRRFAHVERRLAERGASPGDSTLEEMDGYWNEARAADKAAALSIRASDLSEPEVQDLIHAHQSEMHAISPPGTCFVLDLSGLQDPRVRVFGAWRGSELGGIGALKALSDDHGEVKSMRTAPAHLRSGVAAAILEHVIAEARRRGMRRLSLETGGSAEFEPALTLYRRRGFRDGGPYADYQPSDFNHFLHLHL